MSESDIEESDESAQEKLEKTDKENCSIVPLLSEYSKKLESRVKRRYIENISLFGIECKVGSGLFASYRSYESDILFGFGYQLLYC